ncbi:MAG: PAS domain S-box protein [Deltaproteobacteria bacterium]|nr:PAS domain S-box protein [Deltaproteobacteria bacterium]
MIASPSNKEIENRIIQLEEKINILERENAGLKDIMNAFNLLTEVTREAIVIFSPGDSVLFVNDQFFSLFGYQKGDLTRVNSIPSTIAPECEKDVRDKIQTGHMEPYATVGLKRDGTRFPIEIHAREITYLGQKARITAIRDISHRVKAQEAIAESESRYRSLVETMHDGLSLRASDGTMSYNNPAFCNMLGYRSEELIGKPLDIIFDETNTRIIHEQMAKRRKGVPHSYEIELTHKDGGKIPAILSPQDIFDSKGQYQGSFAIFTDITAIKQAEIALKENENKFRSLFHLLPHPISLVSSPSGIYVDVNEAFCNATQYPREEIIGHTVKELGNFPEKERKKFVREARRLEELNGYESFFMTKSRAIRNILLFVKYIHLENERMALTTFIDITERKRLEAQLQQSQKMEAIGTLAGGIAHDFNNILGIILGNTELAIDDVPDWNPGYHNLQEVRKACLRARDVVKQILSFSRASNQTFRSLQITPIIKESLRLLRSSIPSTIDIQQSFECPSDTIKADPTQINQILLNLCTNAAQAMADTGGIMMVRLENIEIREEDELTQNLKPGPYVKLMVSDTGPGIAPEIMNRIFDPYFTTKKIGKGTGIGLAVVQGIVNKHGGAVMVETQINKGTSFHIFLPCVEKIAADEIQTARLLPKGNERILFVDDEKDIVATIPPLLERLGYTVIARTNSLEALEAFRREPGAFDLVVTDQTMPNMTGDKLAEEIRKLHAHIPIILCTGFSETTNEQKSKESGINAYVLKPFDKTEIARVVREMLDSQT